MIPRCEAFLAGVRFYARRHDLPSRFDDSSIAEALFEAERLAADAREEPAALFFSCARRSRAFGGAAGRIVPFVVVSHAASLGIELTLDDLELEILRARVLLGAIDFHELRDRFGDPAPGCP